MNLQKMSALFNVDVTTTLDSDDSDESLEPTSSQSDGVKQKFEDMCEDVKLTLTPDTDEVLAEALRKSELYKESSVASHVNKTEEKTESPKKASKNKVKEKLADPTSDEFSAIGAEMPVEKDPVDILLKSEHKSVPNDNPLELHNDDLIAYQKIKGQYKQFSLYDGNPAYKDFYRYKLLALKSLLTRFQLLNINEMMDELKTVKLDHYINADIIHPNLIATQINESYKWQVRVANLLIEALEQFYAWKRWLEMMRSKLWKDHGLKGAHNRDGLTVEHLHDFEHYVNDMEGFIECARHFDNMLKAASNSLSRQLTCLQYKEQQGLNKVENKQFLKDSISADLGDFDTVESGEVISAPKSSGVLHAVDFGVTETDEFARL